ncbi:helix-turn-helix domain-containing protein [Leisingera methylohalidivorans]|uniref:4-hydroxy-3-methylbut-2-en-1-yl diphosphate synthase n=1 Tax=Leisingera methylohalidivorans DSM 14336 TaxID=999552 RepID=V9VWG8_9RHOB|nr:helix-turn-helix domain-containing protein [Leisingera methylohalidivorans]AHD01222.1 4-hydroxy-3-methylbut-2-en-1-yl diphosphate synthase [Leisingera methylohalidivorans DSM 14336]
MIGRFTQRKQEEHGGTAEPKGFDDFELKLGDVMRGERATMGKSLLDVQRELRIKASYIAAIENSDPSAFDTPGFIAGYVRSYARYLNMDAEEAFQDFCRESGFTVAHGMSAKASSRSPAGAGPAAASTGLGGDAFGASRTPFVPAPCSFLSQIEPRAVGSLMVLAALIGGIGYGGWAVLKEVQQVQFAPVDQTPAVLADLDPLNSAVLAGADGARDPAAEALDRLYRPQALDVPVLVARDAPISTLDPSTLGNFASPEAPSLAFAEASLPYEGGGPLQQVPQVVAEVEPGVEMVAVRPSWVQVTAADGSVILETIMDAGQRFEVPLTEDAPRLRTGESSAIYFAVNGEHFGPVGKRGQVSKNIDLSMEAITGRFALADLADGRNEALATLVAELQADQPAE